MSNIRQGKYSHEIDAYFAARARALPVVASCALCEWTAQGLSGDVLALAKAHRREVHNIKRSRSHKPTRGLRSIRGPDLNEYEQAEVDAEIAKRRKLLGIEDAA